MGTQGPRTDPARRSRTATRAGVALAAAAALAPAAAAAAPADRGPIAYAQGAEIIVAAEGGDARVPLATGADPAWSPDGRLIAHFGDRGIWVRGRDGTGARPILVVEDGGAAVARSAAGRDTSVLADLVPPGSGRGRLAGLGWSHDGSQVRLAVVRRRSTQLFGIDVTTGGIDALPGFRHRPGSAPRDIAWSPAGRLIAFSAAVRAPAGARCHGTRLRVFTHRLRSGVARPIPVPGGLCGRGDVHLRHPAFSPDGTHLVMTRIRRGGGPFGRTDLRTVDVGPRGGAVTPVRPAAPGLTGVRAAAFSPDGQRIAYTFLRWSSFQVTGGLGTMRADGTARRELFSQQGLVLEQPAWGYAPRS